MNFHEHEFLTWCKQPTLFIEGYRFLWNKRCVKGVLQNKFNCKKSAEAVEDGVLRGTQ